ncbi:hypothetical protein E4P41_05900 [Geodermatophilus sp. DF01-2]|uniref:hypothetical protein n=1 Tax=Geodermatophilus sp. DF01-2 TaxID=2559610 RepID=UPI0010745D88|nr:hypothetical protein [Geodermatophilus sp. DF01_2]TFV63042.1 hypothetical protein E4P41_05900 [Geodermatophilus sp. DF01_2]
MDNGLAIAALAYLLIMINTVGAQVGAYTMLSLLFDKRSRYTGVAMGWNLGVIAAGGTAPYLARCGSSSARATNWRRPSS